jgi:hypothetical protein
VVRPTRRPVTLPVPFDIVLTHGPVARPSTARPTEAVAPVPSSRERRRHRSLRPNRTDQTRLTRATRRAVRSPWCRGHSAPAARHRSRTRGLPSHLSGRRRLLIHPHPLASSTHSAATRLARRISTRRRVRAAVQPARPASEPDDTRSLSAVSTNKRAPTHPPKPPRLGSTQTPANPNGARSRSASAPLHLSEPTQCDHRVNGLQAEPRPARWGLTKWRQGPAWPGRRHRTAVTRGLSLGGESIGVLHSAKGRNPGPVSATPECRVERLVGTPLDNSIQHAGASLALPPDHGGQAAYQAARSGIPAQLQG